MTTKHERISNDIRKKILDGTYPENTIIPREIDLMESYDVSRTTIRTAIQTLVNEGLLERKKRQGTRVLKRKIEQDFTYNIQSFNDEISMKGFRPSTRVISLTVVSATKYIAKKLNLSISDEVIKLIRLRFSDEEPVVIVTTYIPLNGFEPLLKINFETESLYSILDKMDSKVVEVERLLEIQSADDVISELLNIEPDDPIFYFETIGRNELNENIEFSIARYRSDNNSFKFLITR